MATISKDSSESGFNFRLTPRSWYHRLTPALLNGLGCGAGAGWLIADLSTPRNAYLAGIAGGLFGFINRIIPRDHDHHKTHSEADSSAPTAGFSP
jgi:hypothetical protein